jgi:ribose/xylose/arabinose/galactoside ABC-type transport system permease subunit
MAENKQLKTVLAVIRSPEFGLMVSIGVLLGVIYLLAPPGSFFTGQAQLSLLQQIGLYGVLAVGAAVVIIAGGIDLSVGAVVALSSVVCAKLMTSWLHDGSTGEPSHLVVVASMAISLLLGLFVGLFHAFLINRFSLPPFIATLATMSGLRSLASILSENRAITLKSELFRKLGRSEVNTFVTFAVVAILVSLMMGCTVLGRHLFAMGGNEAAARLSGLKINRLKSFAYGLSGVLAALAGLLFAGRGGQASPQLGISYELFAITSAVVGGCSLAGGVGSIRGTVLGLILLQTLIRGTGLVVRKIDFFVGKTHVLIELNSTQVEGLVLGTVIILAVAINQRLRPKL